MELIQHADGCRQPAPQLQLRNQRPIAVCYGCGAFADLDVDGLARLVADLSHRVSVLEADVERLRVGACR